MLSISCQNRLKSALTRVSASKEFQAALITPATLGRKATARLIAAMCHKGAAMEVIACLAHGSGTLSLNAQRRVKDMMSREADGKELLKAIQT